jgi:hypothetical protein
MDMGYFKTFRSDIHSLFQSAVDELIPRAAEHFGRPDDDHLLAQATQRICEFKEQQKRVPMHALKGLSDAHGAVDKAWNGLRLLFDLFEARLTGNHELAVKIEDELKFSDIDPEWVDTINRYLEYFGVDGKKQAIPYIRHANMSDFVLNTLPPNATVALIGDWGTGTDEAVNLLRQVQRKQPDVVIHMGDIYYSGTAKENQSYFLDIFEKILDRTRIPVYSLTGNHDMYSGGHGFYEMIRKLNPSPPFDPAQAQPASYFSLRTTDGAWQFLVMDTSLNDHDVFEVADAVTYLDPLEEAWHLDKLANFGGRTILLSHHQLFSAFDGIGKVDTRPEAERAFNPNLLASFRRFQEKGNIAAWFWGHEHNLCVYKPYPPLEKGRCIGHGAIPVFVEDEPYTVMKSLSSPPELVDDPRKPGEKLTLDKNGKIYAHGYVLIKLDDRTKTAQASYYQDTDENTPMYTETL